MSQAGFFIPGGHGPGGIVETLTGNTGGAVGPTGNNINVVGTGTVSVAGNPGTSTLTISNSGSVAISFDTDSGTATPAAGVITFDAVSQAGSSIVFSGSGSTVSLNTTDANLNTILGNGAGNASISGISNQGFGGGSLFYLTTGHDNTAIGHNSLRGEVAGPMTGTFNTATGNESLSRLLSGNFNCAYGYEAGFNYTSSEQSNISIGYDNFGTTGESNVLRIGNGTGTGNGNLNKAFISGINGVTASNPVIVTINSATDQLGTMAVPSGDISITGDSGGALVSNAFTFTGGTTGLTFAGAGTTETLGGTLVVGNGGTGATTFTSHGVLLGNTTSAVTATAAGTTGQVLTGVTGSAPTWQSPAASSITITGDSGGGLTGASFTFTGGTTGLTFSGSGSTETLGGTLAIANGGTDATSFSTSTGIVKYDGTRLVTSSTALIDSSNRTTNTSQPAFLASLNSNATNQTGDGATATLGSAVALTKVFDQGSNFNTNGTFTAPITGKYHLETKIQVVNTTIASQAVLDIVTTARTYETALQRTASSQIICLVLSCLADMSAGDTATVQITVFGEASNSNTLLGSGTTGCFFSGYLVC